MRRYVYPRFPIGLRLATRPAEGPDARPSVCEIVGVARQVRGRVDEIEEVPQVYLPLAQVPMDDIYLAVAPAARRQDGLAAAVREAIARVDKAQLVGVHSIATLEDVARQATSRYRFRAAPVATFAGLALLLAMVGVFGVLGYAVQQRWRELGIRRALGATTSQVVLLVAGGATRLVVTGAAIGLVAAAISGRAVATFLFGVEPLDLTTIAIVVTTLAITAAIAVAAPAVRAARVDAAVACRSE